MKNHSLRKLTEFGSLPKCSDSIKLKTKSTKTITHCRRSVGSAGSSYFPRDSPLCSCRCHRLPSKPAWWSRTSGPATAWTSSRWSVAFRLWTTCMQSWFHCHGSSWGRRFHWAPVPIKLPCGCRAWISTLGEDESRFSSFQNVNRHKRRRNMHTRGCFSVFLRAVSWHRIVFSAAEWEEIVCSCGKLSPPPNVLPYAGDLHKGLYVRSADALLPP